MSAFDRAARADLMPEFLKTLQRARDDAIVREIRTSNEAVTVRFIRAIAFGSTFLPNRFMGVVASVAFSVLVIGASLIFARDPSPFALYRDLQPNPPTAP